LLGKYATPIAPKIIYTNSSVEYWGTGRAAALIHTSIDGTTISTLPATCACITSPDRSTGRPISAAARRRSRTEQPRHRRSSFGNPTPHTIVLRALVLALDRWVRDGVEPPASKYPRSRTARSRRCALKWPR
jgi:hypothetical protein